MLKEQLKNLEPYKPGKQIEDVKKELGLTKVVKLASNENPFGCSPKIGDVLKEMLSELAIYPDGYATELRNKVALYTGVNDNQITFGNGTDEVLQMISRASLAPGTNSIMATPTFPQYKRNVIVDGATPIEVPLKEGRHDLEVMLSKIDHNTKVIWLCNPNNPTGEYIREDELVNFLERVPQEILVVLDEAYTEYVTADDFPNGLEYIDRYPNLIVTRTFSKIYGLAALRIGYGIGQPEFIRMIEALRQPFNVTRLSQKAAVAALVDQSYIEECKIQNANGLKQYYEFCNRHAIDYFPSQGNFILIDVKKPGDDVFNYLMKNGYIVRSGVALGYPTGIRVTIGTKEQNDAVIHLLKEYLA